MFKIAPGSTYNVTPILLIFQIQLSSARSYYTSFIVEDDIVRVYKADKKPGLRANEKDSGISCFTKDYAYNYPRLSPQDDAVYQRSLNEIDEVE